ncbi:MAG: cytochrome ubiquinol oxidase subunit I, partial [Dehalococcoidia bacterium]
AGDDPWDADTLEWSISSPPPLHNFEEIPTVRSNRPLFDQKHPELAENPSPATDDGTPKRHRHIHLPSPSYWPIVLAAGLTIAAFGVIYIHEAGRYFLALGLSIALISVYAWTQEPPIAKDHR